MTPSAKTPSGDDLLSQIWAISTTLTEEAMAAASAKATEAGFDPDRGTVSLAESFINLSASRSVLEDAIETQKLIQLPITVQREFLANLEAISKSLQGLTSGVDEIANLTSSIETLNTSIWKYGLHNLSDQVLGYQKKLNQLKTQELQISKAIAQLGVAKTTAEQTIAAAADLAKTRSDAVATLEQLKQTSVTSVELLEQIRTANTQTNTLYSSAQQYEKQSGELTANIKTASNELSSLDSSIRKFYGEIDEYRRIIAQTSDDASKLITGSEATVKRLAEDGNARIDGAISSLQVTSKTVVDALTASVDAKLAEVTNASDSVVAAAKRAVEVLKEQLAERSGETIEANHKATQELIKELDTLKEKIKEQIDQATGFTLFGAFQARQNEVAKSKNIWSIAIFILVLISAGVTIWIAHEAQSYSAYSFAFWVKLSLTIPLGYAITFCTVQYSRERRLEEEYAFKSSISVSLNPYRDLVHSILEKDGQVDQSKYTEFVIASVTNVFTSPTARVFESEQKPGLTKKTFKEVAEVIGTAVKAAK